MKMRPFFAPELGAPSPAQLAPYEEELAAMLPRIDKGELTLNGAADAIGITRGTACVLYSRIRDRLGNHADQ
jgi:hypothetical protein